MHTRHASRPVRTAAAASILTAAALVVSGCASGSNSSSTDPDEPVTLSYAIWDGNQQPAMEAIAAAFTEEHPNVTIDIQLTAFQDYWTKLQTAASGGGAPDVFWMNGPNFQLYASNGVLAPMDGLDTAVYPKGLVDLYTYEGTVYGAPKDLDTIGVWYNTELFDAAGVAYPEAGWTWDDFRETVTALTDPDAGVWGVVAAPYNQMEYYNTIYQAGGEVIDAAGTQTGFGTPEALEGVTFWTDFIENGESPSAQQMTDTEPNSIFQSGLAAMFWNGSWAGGGYASDEAFADAVNVAPLPAGPAGNQSVVHGLANVAYADGEHLDVALEFAEFASGEFAAITQAESGTVIPAYDGTQDAWVQALPQYDLQVFIDALDTAVPYPVSKNTSAWVSVEGEVITQIWAGNVSAEEGLQDLAARVQDALDKE
ncbi:ABC transporter substrate-binding protein [Agromyces mangrovi Wang et al. 2018]|uniref:ABC transporter substrate-binding protein n=1 Tax=Agromyces mangrovi TaxID=1858653 RepID=UPI0025725911|nr:sugar ABC transporter substrate-binding protein [Agromyces mangrovi]BDZ65192.1 sugar ABC transporter substrate-binding protein [Agromyces mangrovi]